MLNFKLIECPALLVGLQSYDGMSLREQGNGLLLALMFDVVVVD